MKSSLTIGSPQTTKTRQHQNVQNAINAFPHHLAWIDQRHLHTITHLTCKDSLSCPIKIPPALSISLTGFGAIFSSVCVCASIIAPMEGEVKGHTEHTHAQNDIHRVCEENTTLESHTQPEASNEHTNCDYALPQGLILINVAKGML